MPRHSRATIGPRSTAWASAWIPPPRPKRWCSRGTAACWTGSARRIGGEAADGGAARGRAWLGAGAGHARPRGRAHRAPQARDHSRLQLGRSAHAVHRAHAVRARALAHVPARARRDAVCGLPVARFPASAPAAELAALAHAARVGAEARGARLLRSLSGAPSAARRVRPAREGRHLRARRTAGGFAVGFARSPRHSVGVVELAHAAGGQPGRPGAPGGHGRGRFPVLLHRRAGRGPPPRRDPRRVGAHLARAPLRPAGADRGGGGGARSRALDLPALRPRHGGCDPERGRDGPPCQAPGALAAGLSRVLRLHRGALLVARAVGARSGARGAGGGDPRPLAGRRGARARGLPLPGSRVRRRHLPARSRLPAGALVHGPPRGARHARVHARPSRHGGTAVVQPADRPRGPPPDRRPRPSRARAGSGVRRGGRGAAAGCVMKPGEIAKSVSRGAFYLAVEKVAALVSGTVYFALLLRWMGPTKYGIITLGL